jgi:hypothetical protein
MQPRILSTKQHIHAGRRRTSAMLDLQGTNQDMPPGLPICESIVFSHAGIGSKVPAVGERGTAHATWYNTMKTCYHKGDAREPQPRACATTSCTPSPQRRHCNLRYFRSTSTFTSQSQARAHLRANTSIALLHPARPCGSASETGLLHLLKRATAIHFPCFGTR